MPNSSIIPELTEAEKCMTELCKAVQRKTPSEELRKEYQTLCNQVTGGLNKMRAIAEMDDFFSSGKFKEVLNKIK